tara:strand:- start:854 stop:1261 length:408 start_codon:yes stop_codon:yes gene_type:complete
MAQDKKKGTAQDLMLPFLSEKKIMGSDGGNPTPNPDFLRAMQAQQDSVDAVIKDQNQFGDKQDPMLRGTGQPGELDSTPKKPSMEPISMNDDFIKLKIAKQEASKRYAYNFGLPEVMDLLGMEFVSFDERGEEIV